MKIIKPFLWIILGFALGVVCTSSLVGYKVRSFMRSDPVTVQQFTYRVLYSKLDLSESQRTDLQPVMEDFSENLRQIRRDLNPQMKMLMHQTIEKSRPILDAEQQQKLEERIMTLRNRWQSDPSPLNLPDKNVAEDEIG